jgi:hypothetical protein
MGSIAGWAYRTKGKEQPKKRKIEFFFGYRQSREPEILEPKTAQV